MTCVRVSHRSLPHCPQMMTRVMTRVRVSLFTYDFTSLFSLKLTMWLRLASHSKQSFCLSFPSVHHHTRLPFFSFQPSAASRPIAPRQAALLSQETANLVTSEVPQLVQGKGGVHGHACHSFACPFFSSETNELSTLLL